MTKKKLPQFNLTTEGKIHNVTFNFKDSVDFAEKQKETYKSLIENSRYECYFFDGDGNCILLNQDEL